MTGHGPEQLGLGGLALAGLWRRGSSPYQPFCDQRIVLVSTQEDSALQSGPAGRDNSVAGYTTKHIPGQKVLIILMCRLYFTQDLLALFNYSNPILEDVQQYVIYLSVNLAAFFISLAALQQ